jgi:acetolactate synthase-1/2/3 large subunit
VRQYTKLDHRMEHQHNPGLMSSRLLQVAMSEPRGPVYVSVPQETAMLPMPGTARFPTRDQLSLARPVCPDPSDARRIAAWLVQADNPVIYSTRAGHDPDAVAALVRLAELLAISVMESTSADQLNFPMTHWAYGTGAAAKDADVLLVMEDLVLFTPGRGSPSPEAKIAWVAIDPVFSRYKTMEFRADLWIPAAVAVVARAVHEAAAGLLMHSAMGRITDRRARLEQRKRELVAREEALGPGGHRARPARRLGGGLRAGQATGARCYRLNDGLSNGGFVQNYARRTQPGTYFCSGGSSGGWGSGASFGVKLARPDQDVIHATGDGYFMFGTPLSALWAASHHQAAYMAVVFVNGSYSTGTSGLRQAYSEGYGISAGN